MTQTVVITGATGGIGTAIVRALAARGDQVFAVGRSTKKLTALHDESPLVFPVVVDLASPFELPQPLAGLDRLDALVHCAGIAEVASVEESPPTLWQNTLAVNVMAPAELTRGMLPAVQRPGARTSRSTPEHLRRSGEERRRGRRGRAGPRVSLWTRVCDGGRWLHVDYPVRRE